MLGPQPFQIFLEAKNSAVISPSDVTVSTSMLRLTIWLREDW